MGPIVSPVISLDRVTKRFPGRAAGHPALDEVSATIHPGQFVAVIGRSGAGKTTLLRCLARATTVGGGAIHFGDVDLAAVQGRRCARIAHGSA
jgi:ABC-type phosphate/phosphonate transport system ATPase subunit